MAKVLIVLLFATGILLYVGYFSFNKLTTISLASSVNSFPQSTGVGRTYSMTLSDCEPGSIPLFPSYKGKILVEPRQITISEDAKIKIINGDTAAHTIGIAFTKLWEAIKPGDFFEFDTAKLPRVGKWFVTCDGLSLGDNSPVISLTYP